MKRKVSSNIDTINQTVRILEGVNKHIGDLFSDDTGPDSFFNVRMEFLQIFSSLAMNLHQANTIQYLKGGKLVNSLFKSEVDTANAKILEIRMEILDAIEEKMDYLADVKAKLEINDNNLVRIINSLDSSTESSVQLRVFIKNDDHRKQSLIFAIEDTRSKIIIPSLNVLREEFEAGLKILEVITIMRTGKNDEFNPDELARVCEILAMGLDPPSLWQDIQNHVKESELSRELISLKPHILLEDSEIDNLFS